MSWWYLLSLLPRERHAQCSAQALLECAIGKWMGGGSCDNGVLKLVEYGAGCCASG